MVRSCSRTRRLQLLAHVVLLEKLGAGYIDAFFQFPRRTDKSFPLRGARLDASLETLHFGLALRHALFDGGALAHMGFEFAASPLGFHVQLGELFAGLGEAGFDVVAGGLHLLALGFARLDGFGGLFQLRRNGFQIGRGLFNFLRERSCAGWPAPCAVGRPGPLSARHSGALWRPGA